MINEFVKFCTELFPSISPYTKEGLKKAIEEYKTLQKKFLCLNEKPYEKISQGDIFSDIPFYYTDECGDQCIITAKAQLLSNTCDADHDDNIILAAVYPISDISDNAQKLISIKNNTTYNLFYIPDSGADQYVVDFSMLNSISRHSFNAYRECGKIKTLASLSDFGYYLFLAKLTVFFMRPESADVRDSRFVLNGHTPPDFSTV